MDAAAAQSKVQGPAIGLMVYGILQILASCLGIGLNLLSMTGVINQGAFSEFGGDAAMSSVMGGGLGLVMAVPGLVLSFIITFGGLKMKGLQSYGLAMAGAVCAMLPCSCCCIIGIPLGIWALMTLMNDEVKLAFQANAASAM